MAESRLSREKLREPFTAGLYGRPVNRFFLTQSGFGAEHDEDISSESTRGNIMQDCMDAKQIASRVTLCRVSTFGSPVILNPPQAH